MPYLWCSLKTYYEENSLNVDKWAWHNPTVDDQLFDQFAKAEPHIVGLSIYVWNEETLDAIGKKIKEQYPLCLIVVGGPQQNVKTNENYFKDKPWVDIVLPGDAYGEIVLKEILDCYPITDFESVPYIYYTNIDRVKLKSAGTINKRAFVWPTDIFKKQEQYILPLIKQKHEQNTPITAYYETSRGCPYKCIYCEWGGGIYTKVIKKPLDKVCNDLEWLVSVAKVSNIEITDANFGIVKQDIDVAKKLATLRSEYGFPYAVDFDAAKNHVDNVTQIKEILIEAGLINFHKVAFQTLNEETKKNIERVDVPFEQQLESAAKLDKKFGKIPIYLEQILGLPGETYDTVCKQIDKIFEHGLDIGVTLPVAWTLLPEAPAYTQEMRDKFKIKTVKKLVEINPKIKEGRTFEYSGSGMNLVGSWTNKSVETVVGTYSYTPADWVRMRKLYSFVVGGHPAGINTYLVDYLHRTHGSSPSQVYNAIMEYAYTIKFKDANLNRLFAIEKQHSNLWITDDTVLDIGIDIGDEWPFQMPQHTFFSFAILSNAQAFYTEVCNHLAVMYSDPRIIDLGKYIANVLLDVTYNYKHGRTFTTKYNWLEYFNKLEPLSEEEYTYNISDTEVTYIAGKAIPIWNIEDQNRSHIAYYHQMAVQVGNVKVSTTIKRL